MGACDAQGDCALACLGGAPDVRAYLIATACVAAAVALAVAFACCAACCCVCNKKS